MAEKEKRTLTAERIVLPEIVPEQSVRGHVARTLEDAGTDPLIARSPFDIAADKLSDHPGWDDFLEAYHEMKRAQLLETEEAQFLMA